MASTSRVNTELKPIKLILVGEICSGKTWLWHSYFFNRKPNIYTQTVFDNHTSTVSYEDKQIPVTLFETCGEDDYSQLRKTIYSGAHVIIFCISIESPSLWTNQGKSSILEKWCQEFKEHCKGIPIIIVGTKADIRDNPDILLSMAEKKLKPLKTKDLLGLCKKLKGSAVVESSAATKDGLQVVFNTAIKLALNTIATNEKNKW